MTPFARLATAAVLCGASSAALATPLALVFSGTILSFNKAGSPAGKAGDPFSGKIVFDLAQAPSAVQNDNGTLRATAGGSGGCSVHVDGGCVTDTGPVPAPLVLFGTVTTTLGDFAIGPATNGILTGAYVSRVDATANGGAQNAKYTLGNFDIRYDASASGYERTTFNQMIGLDLTANNGGLFYNAANLGGSIDTDTLTSGLFNFSSTQIRAHCERVDLTSCDGGSYDNTLPQVDLFGKTAWAYVSLPENVPEPGSIALLAGGATALVLTGRRRVRS